MTRGEQCAAAVVRVLRRRATNGNAALRHLSVREKWVRAHVVR
jgi:hypothetical protein